jgi:tRNA(Ile2) C34 agmatinyltransferase TiaS
MIDKIIQAIESIDNGTNSISSDKYNELAKKIESELLICPKCNKFYGININDRCHNCGTKIFIRLDE